MVKEHKHMSVLQQSVQEWMATFNLNHRIIEMQMDGLSHTDTLLELPFRGNRLNWVIGHLAEHRDWMLRAVECTTLMPAKQVEIYRRGSEPLTDDQAVDIETLMGYLRQSKDCILSTLETTTDDFLSEKPDTGILMESQRDRTRFQRLQGLLWHETYHVGQLELLRQLTGVNDAILS